MKKGKDLVLTIVFLVGLAILLYPLGMNYIQKRHHNDVVSAYKDKISSEAEEEVNKKKELIRRYNEIIVDGVEKVYGAELEELTDLYKTIYEDTNGVMCTLEIPKIDVNLPVYTGTDDSTLEVGIGHVESTSLPMGGEGTNCVLSGHRGLPGSKLFTRLDEIKEGDMFFLKVFDDTLAYKVYNINIVDPDDITSMEIEKGKDRVTLVTCTPYGLNTHRLVVTGERVPYEQIEYESIAKTMPSVREVVFMLIPFVILALGVGVLIGNLRSGKKKGGS